MSLGARALNIECSRVQHYKMEMRERMKAGWECKTGKTTESIREKDKRQK